MGGHPTIRALRYAAYCAAALVVLLVAAALAVPAFLDTPAVERELKAKLSQLVQGEIAWEKLSIRLLPSPRGSLSKVTVEIPGVASVHAESVDARLRLLPLLRGNAEIASVSLSRPEVRLEIAPPTPALGGSKPAEEAPSDPVEGYRSAVDAIRRFAPDAELGVEDGLIDVVLPGMPQVKLRQLELHGETGSKGMTLKLTAASDAWNRLEVRAKVDFSDLSGAAKLDISGLKVQDWIDQFLDKSPVRVAVPEASLRVDARSDGKTRIQADFVVLATTAEVFRASERVRLPDVAIAGGVTANREEIALRLTRARLGASRLESGSLRYGLKSASLATIADFDLDLAQAMDATRRLLPEETVKSLAPIQTVSGRAQGQVKFEMRRSVWNTLVDIRKSDASVGLEGLPGPVRLAAARVGVTGDAVRIERADVAMLDARALGSARIGYGKQLRIEGTVSQGSVGENLLAWVWKTVEAPPHLALKTPIAVAVQRVAWSSKQPLDVTGVAVSFGAGSTVAVDLGWTPEVLDIRRATIKDARSDAQIALHLEKRLLEGRFSGSLQSASIGSMLRSAKLPEGGFSGDLRSRVDLNHPERFSATGKLAGASVDLEWLLGHPVTVERFDVQADGQKLLVRQASVNWAQQHFALRGEVARAADGAPIIDAQIDSPGVVVDALLRGVKAKAPAAEEKKAPKEDEPLWTEWPLPVRGQITFGSKFVQYGERRAEPVSATLTLEEQRAFLELQQVQLCGISFPLTVEAKREGLAIAVRLAAQKQQLEQTARCLTERGVQIDGEFDLSANLRTRGRVPELLSNLEGTVEAEARNGIVRKFAMLGNILSTQAVSGMFDQDRPKLDEKGFPYRSITAKGRFQKGSFIIDESFFRSDVIGIAANGSISLIDDKNRPYDSRLTVLVAPLGKLDRVVRSVPVLGYLLGGILTSVPVSVSGDIRNPLVVPLGPGAVLGELVGVFERTLKLPGRVLPKPAQPSPPE
jgi:hypothetical protein